MIEQRILAIPPDVLLEVERLNREIEAAHDDGLIRADLLVERDRLLQTRTPMPLSIGDQF